MCAQVHTLCLSAYGSMTLEGRVVKERKIIRGMEFESLSKQFKVMSDAGTDERESEEIGKQKERGVKEMWGG